MLFRSRQTLSLTKLFFRVLLASECIQKFGAELGEEVWEAVNAIFDVLPLAAIIDNKVKLSASALMHN